MSKLNIIRVIISYILLAIAFAVYFVLHILWLEVALLIIGFFILLSALHYHRQERLKSKKDFKKKLMKTKAGEDQAQEVETKKIIKDSHEDKKNKALKKHQEKTTPKPKEIDEIAKLWHEVEKGGD